MAQEVDGDVSGGNPQGEISMAKRNANASADQSESKKSESITVTRRGIKTGHDFANLMSSVMADLIEGRMEPGVANAVCNAGGKLLKVVEMQNKYGKKPSEAQEKVLILATGMEAVQ